MNAVLFRMTGGFSVALGVVLSALLAAPEGARADAEMEVEGDLEVTGNVKVGTTTVDSQHIAHFKGRVLAENGETSSGTARNEGFSLWTDEAFGIERHYSNSSWQTAVFGRGTDSTAITFGAYLANAVYQQSLLHFLTIKSNGDVGIGTESPFESLTIDGNDAAIAIEEHGTSSPNTTTGYAKLYVDDGEMFALDDDGNDTQLTSHADPRDYGEAVSTSFADPSVDLPFSFHHKNRFVGRGAVVDLAALVRDVQAMTGKSYTTYYDVPFEATDELLARYPWIEIPIEEAWEEYEAMVPERATAYEYDLVEQSVYPVEVPTGGDSEVGTGILKRRLKENVRFEPETGKFFRRPTAAEIPPDSAPDLPAWIADRLAAE